MVKVRYQLVLFLLSLLLGLGILMGCGGGGGESQPPSGGSNNWDEMKWDQAEWG